MTPTERQARDDAQGDTVVHLSRQHRGAEHVSEQVGNLGARLKRVRLSTGMSLREVARQLGVSPSFVSQLENGKSQPSVATLYSLAQLLGVSIDELFAVNETRARDTDSPVSTAPPATEVNRRPTISSALLSRSDLASPVDAVPGGKSSGRVSLTQPGGRSRLEMDTGVIWERLANNTGSELDFIEIIYPPFSQSTNDSRMLQHAGSEYGYLLEGQLEIVVGFDVLTLHAGEALGFDSSQPHLFRNLQSAPARGVWVVQHPQHPQHPQH
ncbi:MAG: putative Transcriptional regulator [Humibacillus sp.]|nr:putative Transcriptional regulator [Humibacillus sp.]